MLSPYGLKVFVNNRTEPDMDVTLLRTDLQSGNILLKSMFGTSYFANVSIKELPLEKLVSTTKEINEQFLRKWEISEQLPINSKADFNDYQELVAQVKEWRQVDDKNDNYVNLCKYFNYPKGIVVAKHKIVMKENAEKILHFDFIGDLKILLNGQDIFNYRKQDLNRVFDGTLKTVLDLIEGENDLVFIIEGDAFLFGKGYNSMGRLQHQNWGFIATLKNKQQ